ncbi:MAG: hypothetical protein IJK28_02480 [Clostridia bacterium]|nr:hypothetical protein [Clostridia bacterium]
MIRLVNEQKAKPFEFLINLIPPGRAEAIPMKTLSKLLDCPSSDVRESILNARKVGVLICSGDDGYYFPADDGELKEYVNRRRKYIRTAEFALKHFEEVLTEYEDGDLT